MSREDVCFLTSSMRLWKTLDANVADPMGWPRSLKPVVSSTGISGADFLVGCGVVENDAMEVDSDCAKRGS